ncbi:MAG: SCP2 sterol-binding domain-containing protein [Legionellaceae bacterium]|nr:SCP2 sterol-binding domain-containing protein [Legionellaceae bacterium]
MIKKYSLMALEKAINHAFSLDESMPDKLCKLHGKVLEIIITPLQVCFFITFENEKVQLLEKYSGRADAIIQSNPIGLIRLSILPASKVRSLFNDKVKLTGDIILGQDVKKLFDELDIDWEGHLAQFTGDVVASQIGSLFREGQAFKQKIVNSVQRNVTEYLQEEQREFPNPEEVEDFFDDVDDLALRTERLSAHIKKLLVET